jgi:hypothetical protein
MLMGDWQLNTSRNADAGLTFSGNPAFTYDTLTSK